jgi:hypothetical protein
MARIAAFLTVTIRLMALDAVLDDGKVRGWMLPGSESEITYVHADLLRAAADEPIVEGPEGQPIFIAGSFRQRLLQIAASRGNA